MDTDTTCGAAIWGPGSITRPPIGHCIRIPGHPGEHSARSVHVGKVYEQFPVHREVDIDLTCPYEKWKPIRDICSPTSAIIFRRSE